MHKAKNNSHKGIHLWIVGVCPFGAALAIGARRNFVNTHNNQIFRLNFVQFSLLQFSYNDDILLSEREVKKL